MIPTELNYHIWAGDYHLGGQTSKGIEVAGLFLVWTLVIFTVFVLLSLITAPFIWILRICGLSIGYLNIDSLNSIPDWIWICYGFSPYVIAIAVNIWVDYKTKRRGKNLSKNKEKLKKSINSYKKLQYIVIK